MGSSDNIMKGKVYIKSNAHVECARCDADAQVFDTTWKRAVKVFRSNGWSELKDEGWICPICARGRKAELMVKKKNFRGKFRKDGKMFVKTANGVFPVGEVKGK